MEINKEDLSLFACYKPEEIDGKKFKFGVPVLKNGTVPKNSETGKNYFYMTEGGIFETLKAVKKTLGIDEEVEAEA